VGGKTYAAGALLTAPWEKFLAGSRDFEVLFQPGPRTSLAGFATTRQHILLNELDNVRNRLYVLTREGAAWKRTPLPAPEFGSVSASAVDEESDDYFLNVAGFLTPSSLYLGTVGQEKRELLKQLPAFFNAEGLEVSQHEAVSKDGTRVPYFAIMDRHTRLDGDNSRSLTHLVCAPSAGPRKAKHGALGDAVLPVRRGANRDHLSMCAKRQVAQVINGGIGGARGGGRRSAWWGSANPI